MATTTIATAAMPYIQRALPVNERAVLAMPTGADWSGPGLNKRDNICFPPSPFVASQIVHRRNPAMSFTLCSGDLAG
jgi:hypothetical protein